MSFLQNERCPICGDEVFLKEVEFPASDEMCDKHGYERGSMVFTRYRVSCVSCSFSSCTSNCVEDAVKDFYEAKNTILYPEGKHTAKWHTSFPNIEGMYIVDEGIGPFLRRFAYVGGKWITAVGPLEHIAQDARFFGPIPNFSTQE